MKKYFLVIAFFISICFHAQEKVEVKGVTWNINSKIDTTTVKIYNDFFLLGTLNDYTGYPRLANGNYFDSYNDAEEVLMNYVDSLVKIDYSTSMVKEKNRFISKEMTSKMLSYYDGYEIKEDVFDSKQKKLSFLLGVYLRFGTKINDNYYKIQLANSAKHQTVYEILKSLGVMEIFYKRLNNIPRQDIFYFKATPPILDYFNKVENKKDVLHQNFKEKFKSKISNDSRIDEMFEKIKTKDLEIIKTIGE